MIRFSIRDLLCPFVFAAFITGCRTYHPVTIGIKDPSLMATTISARVPAGTAVEKAQKFMEREGFRCSPKTNAEFAGLDDKMDYLYCDRSEGEMSSVDRRWQVALVHRDGKVVRVVANTGLVGP